MPTTRRQKAQTPQKEEEQQEEAPSEEDESKDEEPEAEAGDDSDRVVAEVVSDPPPQEAIRNLFDLIDYRVGLVLLDRKERTEHMKTLQYFWKQYPFRNVEFGRLALRVKLANLLTDCCGVPPYQEQQRTTRSSGKQPKAQDDDEETESDSDKEEEDQTEQDDVSMILWKRGRWTAALEDLKSLKASLRRKDAHAQILTSLDEDELEDDQDVEDENILSGPAFTRKLESLQRLLEIHEIVAPIHKPLLDMVEEYRQTGKTPARKKFINDKQLKQVIDLLKKSKTDMVRTAVDALFEEDILGPRKRGQAATTVTLINLDDLARILEEQPYDLNYTQAKIERLIQRWNAEGLGLAEPALIRLRYGITKGGDIDRQLTPHPARNTTPRSNRRRPSAGKAKEALVDIRQNRQALNNAAKHGEDPIIAARGIAAGARGSGASKKRTAGSGGGERKTAKRLKFGDDDDDSSVEVLEEDEEDDEQSLSNIKLSDIPAAMDKKRLQSPKPSRAGSKFAGAPPDEGIFNKQGKVVARRIWTDEEKEAVKLGVAHYGTGYWKEIKLEYPKVLRNRTSVQIKDCWRTMIRKGEVELKDYEETTAQEVSE